MSLVSDVAGRLQAQVATGPAAPLASVSTVGDVMAARGELRRPVEAWVMAWDSDARAPRNATGPLRQQETESVMVMIGWLYAGATGGGIDPEEVQDAVVAALLGWTPPGRAAPLRLRGARLVSFDADTQTLFRQVVFETERLRVAVF